MTIGAQVFKNVMLYAVKDRISQHLFNFGKRSQMSLDTLQSASIQPRTSLSFLGDPNPCPYLARAIIQQRREEDERDRYSWHCPAERHCGD